VSLIIHYSLFHDTSFSHSMDRLLQLVPIGSQSLPTGLRRPEPLATARRRAFIILNSI